MCLITQVTSMRTTIGTPERQELQQLRAGRDAAAAAQRAAEAKRDEYELLLAELRSDPAAAAATAADAYADAAAAAAAAAPVSVRLSCFLRESAEQQLRQQLLGASQADLSRHERQSRLLLGQLHAMVAEGEEGLAAIATATEIAAAALRAGSPAEAGEYIQEVAEAVAAEAERLEARGVQAAALEGVIDKLHSAALRRDSVVAEQAEHLGRMSVALLSSEGGGGGAADAAAAPPATAALEEELAARGQQIDAWNEELKLAELKLEAELRAARESTARREARIHELQRESSERVVAHEAQMAALEQRCVHAEKEAVAALKNEVARSKQLKQGHHAFCLKLYRMMEVEHRQHKQHQARLKKAAAEVSAAVAAGSDSDIGSCGSTFMAAAGEGLLQSDPVFQAAQQQKVDAAAAVAAVAQHAEELERAKAEHRQQLATVETRVAAAEGAQATAEAALGAEKKAVEVLEAKLGEVQTALEAKLEEAGAEAETLRAKLADAVAQGEKLAANEADEVRSLRRALEQKVEEAAAAQAAQSQLHVDKMVAEDKAAALTRRVVAMCEQLEQHKERGRELEFAASKALELRSDFEKRCQDAEVKAEMLDTQLQVCCKTSGKGRGEGGRGGLFSPRGEK